MFEYDAGPQSLFKMILFSLVSSSMGPQSHDFAYVGVLNSVQQ